MIKNPVLRGFNPDPSICRVNDDYYIAVSTFEWFPGVLIYHSLDLCNWKLIKKPLERLSQLNMLGNPDSTGIWAPCLSYDKDKFYLVYTDVKQTEGPYKDMHNYLVTCNKIDGSYSDPIYLNGKGFDPSLFHDDDGKKYLVQMVWDHRQEFPSTVGEKFAGIILQEYDPVLEKLVGFEHLIFDKTPIQLSEGPHLYKKDGYYYLLMAEGGTVYEHSVSIARSKNILGPYEHHPSNPILSSYLDPANQLQKAGHASMVETSNGEYYLAHLCGRPLENDYPLYAGDRGDCCLGRETSIQKIYWEDSWPYVVNGPSPSIEVEGLSDADTLDDKKVIMDHFDKDSYDENFQTLRIPLDDTILNLKERPSHLRLYGRHSLGSKFVQAQLSRRWQSFTFEASTCVDYRPTTFQQSAGLCCYYNSTNHTYIGVTYDKNIGRCIEIAQVNNNVYSTCGIQKIRIDDDVNNIYFKVNVNHRNYVYSYSFDNINWTEVKHVFYSGYLSDDYILKQQDAFFTGAFVGMYCYDIAGLNSHADFDYFRYEQF